MIGNHWALLGAAVAFIGGAIGSSIGITYVSNVSSGVLSEDPDKFGRLLPIIAMPGSQGFYGFIIAFLVWVFFLNAEGDISPAAGLEIFLATLPAAVANLVAAIYQGLTGVGAVGIIAKRAESAGQALILVALVETYAMLSTVLSFLLLIWIRGS